MNKEELKKVLKKLQEEYYLKIKDLKKTFALSNNPYKVGDIISDHIGTIKIESIGVYINGLNDGLPECTYHGPELKKDLTPKKMQQYEAGQQFDWVKLGTALLATWKEPKAFNS